MNWYLYLGACRVHRRAAQRGVGAAGQGAPGVANWQA